MKPTRGRGPNVPFPPPLVFVAGFGVGWLLDRYVVRSWPAMSARLEHSLEVVASVLVVAGLALAFWGILTFRRLRTAVYPNRDASTLVIEGPYRFSRNPMYSGMMLAYLGASGLAHMLWPVVLLPLVMVAMYKLVIEREERHLTAMFGDAYLSYRSKVERWLF